MEELIFFAVIIFFSIVESIARSRRAKQREAEAEGQAPDELPAPERWEPMPPDFEIETYEEEPTYDEVATAPRPSTSPSGGGGERRSSSETMLPGELLEELAELTGRLERGKSRPAPYRPPSPPLPVPGPRTRLPVPRAPRPGGKRPERLTERMPEPHEVHLSHWDYGTDPSERAPSKEGVIDPFAERHNPDAAAVHRQLRSRSRSTLRRAIILNEVLGQPMALREDRFQS